MSRTDDAMIAAEDGPSLGPERTREEWHQLAASLDVAYRAPTLAVLPDWSELASAKPERVFDDGFFEFKTRPDVLVEYRGRYNEPPVHRYEPADSPHPGGVVIGTRPFAPTRDIPAALREAKAAFNFDWGTILVGDPIVFAALDEAEFAEHLHATHGAAYRCDACLDVGILGSVFDWAGALFVHLLTCPHFKGKT